MSIVCGTVVRGFIMRYCHEEQWEEELEEYEGELIDGDAIPYYVQGEDGRYYEWYPHQRPKDKKVYLIKG